MVRRLMFAVGALLALSACSETEQPPPAKAVEAIDPRTAQLENASTLADAEAVCTGVKPYATDPKDKKIWGSCATRMSELIEIKSFEAGLQSFKAELKDGKVTSLKAMAYQRALENWLLSEAKKQSSKTLFAWREQIPTSEEDTAFLYGTMRNHINDALKKKT